MSETATMTPHQRYMELTPTVALDAFQWEDISADTNDAPGIRLLASLKLGGTFFHVEAWAVVEDNDYQRTVSRNYRDNFYGAAIAFDPDGSWNTVKIPGFDRDYVVFVYPHS